MATRPETAPPARQAMTTQGTTSHHMDAGWFTDGLDSDYSPACGTRNNSARGFVFLPDNSPVTCTTCNTRVAKR